MAADGISRRDCAPALVNFVCCSARHSVAGAEPEERGHIHLYFSVGLELVPNVIATSSERTYQGHSGTWLDVRVPCDTLYSSSVAGTA